MICLRKALRDEREHLGSEWTKSTEQLFLEPCRSGSPGLLFMQFKHEWYGWYRRYWFRLLLRLTIHTVSLPCISRRKGKSLTGLHSCGQILKCETANLKQDCARLPVKDLKKRLFDWSVETLLLDSEMRPGAFFLTLIRLPSSLVPRNPMSGKL